jgi:hypothetical protein
MRRLDYDRVWQGIKGDVARVDPNPGPVDEYVCADAAPDEVVDGELVAENGVEGVAVKELAPLNELVESGRTDRIGPATV